MAAKRKRVGPSDSPAAVAQSIEAVPNTTSRPARKQRKISTNPDTNPDVLDAPEALRASPDADPDRAITSGRVKPEEAGDSPLSALSDPDVPDAPPKKAAPKKARTAKAKSDDSIEAPSTPAPSKKKAKAAAESDTFDDPEAEDGEEATEEEVREAISRPPPVHSSYLPLPWKGRLGYACLNTYLRQSNPPVFCSRTCRIASILEHRHPLKDPSQPEHATKNRPDRDQPASIERGKKYLEDVCLANVRDLPKMIRWNDKYGIKFLRLSSEMFPFASHEEYGYKLAPFASEALAEAGKVIAKLGHRVTTHPGQFTQLGSPRKSVIDNALRDLEYHDEMLSLLKLPEQQNRDAVMILHMGGVFGDKETAMQRFRENYAKLSQSVKNRLVLENDDVSYHVHDLLPICEELNIPLVLDFHHHNILFDPDHVREGCADIVPLFPRILATWKRKGITPKMHYSEPTPAAITPRQRRKHNPRVSSLPPCPDDMDLMIEAKDKEQAVFQLMRDFKLPGWDRINDIIPYVRDDDNKATLAAIAKQQTKKAKAAAKSSTAKKRASTESQTDEEASNQGLDDSSTAASVESSLVLIPDEDVGMGGPHNRVFWPVGMEEWLRPKKRVVASKPTVNGSGGAASAKDKKPMDIAERKRQLAAAAVSAGVKKEEEDEKDSPSASDSDINATPATKKAKKALKAKDKRQKAAAAEAAEIVAGRKSNGAAVKKGAVAVPASKGTTPATNGSTGKKSAMPSRKKAASKGTKRGVKVESEEEEEEEEEFEDEQDGEDQDENDQDADDGSDVESPVRPPRTNGTRLSARSAKRGRVDYSQRDDEEL